MRRCSPGPSTSRRRNSRSSSGTKGSDGGEGLPGDVLILAEHLEGHVAPSTLEAIAVGRELGSRSGGHARVALFGHDVRVLADVLAGTGTEVLLADDPALAEYTPDGYGQAARAVVESATPRLILVAHTSQGYDLAPALAGAMDLPLVTNCLALRFDGERLIATRRLLNEKVQAEVEIASSRPIVATVRPGSVKPAGPSAGGTVSVMPVRIDPSKARTRFLSIERPLFGGAPGGVGGGGPKPPPGALKEPKEWPGKGPGPFIKAGPIRGAGPTRLPRPRDGSPRRFRAVRRRTPWPSASSSRSSSGSSPSPRSPSPSRALRRSFPWDSRRSSVSRSSSSSSSSSSRCPRPRAAGRSRPRRRFSSRWSPQGSKGPSR